MSAWIDEALASTENGTAGIGVLQRLAAEVKQSKTPGARAALLAALFGHPGAVAALGASLAHGGAGFKSALWGVKAAAPGMSEAVAQIESIAKDNRPPPPPREQPREDEAPDVAPEPWAEHEPLAAVAVPGGWVLTASGVWEERFVEGAVSRVLATKTPIAVIGVLESIRDRSERIQLRWRKQSGQWVDAVVPRSNVRDTRKIVALCDEGVDVGSSSARQVSAWLSAQEAAGGALLPRSAFTDRMGWVMPNDAALGRDGFLVGEAHIRKAGHRGRNVVLDTTDPGRAQLAHAMRPSGTLEGWRDAMEPVLAFPSALLALYASLATPLMALIPEAPSGVLDWSGESSHGKTTTLRVACSPWGDPRDGGHLLQSWESTPPRLEGIADCLHYLPTLIDDTRKAKFPQDVERVIFTYVGEVGKGRARPDGLRASTSSRGLLLSSGEQPITSFGNAAGARARSLCFRGYPFGADNNGGVVELQAAIEEHHGTAGPALVQWLLDNPARWAQIRQAWLTTRAAIAARMATAPGKRLAALLATLEAGSYAAHDVLGLPQPRCKPIDFAARTADDQADDADRPAAALAASYAWACAHSTEFWGRHIMLNRDTPRQPTNGWAGSWASSTTWSEIAWDPGCIKRVLEREGFRAEEVFAAWVERKWLKVDGRNRGRFKVTGPNSESTRLYWTTRQAIETACGPVAEDAPEH